MSVLLQKFILFLPRGKGLTAVIIFVKQSEEIRKSVGDLLKLLSLRLESKKTKIMFLFHFFFSFLSALFIFSLKFCVQLLPLQSNAWPSAPSA